MTYKIINLIYSITFFNSFGYLKNQNIIQKYRGIPPFKITKNEDHDQCNLKNC